METLSGPVSILCKKKAFKNDKFSKLFCINGTNGTDEADVQLIDVKTRTKRYLKSPLPYLIGLLNQELRDNNTNKCYPWIIGVSAVS